MTRLIWIVALVLVALWSLFAWGAYGLLDVFGDIAVRNADIVPAEPEAVEWLGWAIAWVRSLGLTAVVLVWALVSALILAVPALLSLVTGGRRRHSHLYPPTVHRQTHTIDPRPDHAQRARDLVDRFDPPRR